MFSYLPLAAKACLQLGPRLLLAVPSEGWRHAWKRLPLFALLWLAFIILSLLHAAGFLLDEIFFRGYRRMAVEKPVFIVGIPRSGTTFLHRVLAADQSFTSLSTWEVILAPSVTERHLWRLVGALLSPLGYLLQRARRLLLRRMDKIHRIGLQEPEEDFLLLVWIQSCFLLAFLCPDSPCYWRLGRFDEAVPERERRRVLDFYQACLRKHLYYHGHGRRLLSKNPSFTPMIGSLRERFSDASVIACLRPPREALPSQLSSLRPAMRLLGGGSLRPAVQAEVIRVLHDYYRCIGRAAREAPLAALSMQRLRDDLRRSVVALYDFIDQPLTADFLARLDDMDGEARDYRSGHRYRAADFDLGEEEIDARFRDVWPPGREVSLEVA